MEEHCLMHVPVTRGEIKDYGLECYILLNVDTEHWSLDTVDQNSKPRVYIGCALSNSGLRYTLFRPLACRSLRLISLLGLARGPTS